MDYLIRKIYLLLSFIAIFLSLKAGNIDSRQKYNFNSSWKFVKANIPGAADEKYDDTSWETVSCHIL